MLLRCIKTVQYYWHCKNDVAQEYTEHELIEGCKRQQPKVQEYLYKRYYSDFMKVCMRYAPTVHDAEQWLNDGFYKVFTKVGMFDGKGSFEGWMKRVLVNTCLDQLRLSKKQSALQFKEVEENTVSVLSVHIQNDALQSLCFKEIISALQQLPETYRTVFNLHVFDGLGHKEIAAQLNIKEGTSHWYLNKAREMMKEKISQQTLKNK
ncbi:hypothetical protein CAP35_14465 [Chitinophagaceae bacterium IBVUCB1]|nr:hypothetical protein CAP35_14465 [Chitinophagaceae bacterium IBVUCB1]